MSAAIRIEGLGKRYRLARGGQRAGYQTLRESLVGAVTAPFRRRAGGAAVAERTEEFWALNDVSFDVQPGEVVGIIGRNGAGKSTLLKVLSRITKPTTGRVEINGRVGSLLEVGTGFHPELTGRENVYLNGSILGMSRAEIARKFDEIVAFAEVEKFLDTPVKRYSSGMYVRLAFAVAAHLEPEILIVDEVLAVGDAGFQQKCLNKMRECARNGRTVLLVSHQLNSVRDLCDHALWLAGGTVRMNSTVDRVLDKYLNELDIQTQVGEWVDLTAAPRTGHGPARIVRAMYRGAGHGRPPESDGRLHVEVDVSVPEGCALPTMLVEFQVTDKLQTKLLSVTTFDRRQPLQLAAGITRISFVVDEVHLAPGRYPVNLILGDLSDFHDVIGSAMWLHIAEPPVEDRPWTEVAPVTRRSRHSVSRPAESDLPTRSARCPATGERNADGVAISVENR